MSIHEERKMIMSTGRSGVNFILPGLQPQKEEPKAADPVTFQEAKELLDEQKAEEERRNNEKFDLNKVDWARVGTSAGGAWLSHWLASSLFGDDDEDENRSFWSKALSKIIPIGAAGLGAYGGWKIPDLVKSSSSDEERKRALATVRDSVRAVANQVRNEVKKKQNENLQERKDKLWDIGGNVIGGVTGAGLTIDGARRWLNARGDARVMNENALAAKGVTEADKALAEAVQNAELRGNGIVENAIIGTQAEVREREMAAAGKKGPERTAATAHTNEARDAAKAIQDRAAADAASGVEAAKAKGTADLNAAKRRLAEAKEAVEFRGAPSKPGGRPKMTATKGRGVVRSGNPKAPWKPGWGHKAEIGVGVPLLGWNLYKGIVNNDELGKINADIDDLQSGYEDWMSQMDSAVPEWRSYVPAFTPPKR